MYVNIDKSLSSALVYNYLTTRQMMLNQPTFRLEKYVNYSKYILRHWLFNVKFLNDLINVNYYNSKLI